MRCFNFDATLCRGTCTPHQQTIKQTINIGKWREERTKWKTNSDFVWTRFFFAVVVSIRFADNNDTVCLPYISGFEKEIEKIRRAHAGTKIVYLKQNNCSIYEWVGGDISLLGQRKRRINAIARTMAQSRRTRNALRERAIIIKQLNNRTSAQIKVRDRQCAQEIVIYILFVWRSQESCVCVCVRTISVNPSIDPMI